MTTIIIRSAASLLIVLVLLFIPAGRIDWLRGWLFLGILAAFVTATALYLRRVNPEIFIARRRIQPGTKRWDRILLIFLLGAMMAILPVAAPVRVHTAAASPDYFTFSSSAKLCGCGSSSLWNSGEALL